MLVIQRRKKNVLKELGPMAFSDLSSVFCYQNLEQDNLESSGEFKTSLFQISRLLLCHWGGLVGSGTHSLFFSV